MDSNICRKWALSTSMLAFLRCGDLALAVVSRYACRQTSKLSSIVERAVNNVALVVVVDLGVNANDAREGCLEEVDG